MTSPLARAIDLLSDPNVRAADALRNVLVVAMRLNDEDLVNWVHSELDGYPEDANLPEYRRPGSMPIRLTFHGPMGSSATSSVFDGELPESLRPGGTKLRQPLAELDDLSSGSEDPQWQLPSVWLQLYRRAAARGDAPGWEMMELNYARVIYPRSMLRGVLDRVKTSALRLLLDLEAANPDAGTPGGPTAATDPKLGPALNVFLTNVYGADATVTIGDDATVATGAGATAVRLEAGDVDGLLEAANALLSPAAVDELADALSEDGNKPGERTRAFLGRLQAGAVVVAGGVAGDAAYSGLMALLRQVFPGLS